MVDLSREQARRQLSRHATDKRAERITPEERRSAHAAHDHTEERIVLAAVPSLSTQRRRRIDRSNDWASRNERVEWRPIRRANDDSVVIPVSADEANHFVGCSVVLGWLPIRKRYVDAEYPPVEMPKVFDARDGPALIGHSDTLVLRSTGHVVVVFRRRLEIVPGFMCVMKRRRILQRMKVPELWRRNRNPQQHGC